MAWIESHQEIARHPKTKKLARLLGVSLPTAIGHLHLLWWWAMDFAKDGDLSRYDPEEIADGAMWEGDAQKFLDSLIQAGFVDRDETGIYLHDWDEYAGKLLERKAKDNSRKKDIRRAYENGTITAVRQRDGDRCRYCGTVVDWADRKGPRGGTYDHIDPNGPTTIENLVVCCRACNAKKGARTPEEAGMRLLPVLNQIRTKSAPNPDQIRSNSGSDARQVAPNMQQSDDTSLREEEHTPEDETPEPMDDDLAAVVHEFEACGYGTIHERIREQLIDMVDTYGREWVIQALRVGMEQGKRTLAYVSGILQNWQARGGITLGPPEQKQTKKQGNHGRNQPGSSRRDAAEEFNWNELSL